MKPRRKSQKRGPVVGGKRSRNDKESILERQTALVVTAQEEVAKEKESDDTSVR